MSSTSTKLLKWLKDYISERKQQVLLNNSISSLGTLKAGIPQALAITRYGDS
jgi:hypothetical protein